MAVFTPYMKNRLLKEIAKDAIDHFFEHKGKYYTEFDTIKIEVEDGYLNLVYAAGSEELYSKRYPVLSPGDTLTLSGFNAIMRVDI